MPDIGASTHPAADANRNFIAAVITRAHRSTGDAADLRHADDSGTGGYSAWSFLVARGIDITKEWATRPYLVVTAAVARTGVKANGAMRFGGALAQTAGAGLDMGALERSPAAARLHRLVACVDTGEACDVIRSMLKLIESKGGAPLDYARLLGQLRRFGVDRRTVGAEWTQEFFSGRGQL